MSLFKSLSSVKNYAKASGVDLAIPQASVDTIEELCHEVCEVAMDEARGSKGKGKVGAVYTHPASDGALHVLVRAKHAPKGSEGYVGTTVK